MPKDRHTAEGRLERMGKNWPEAVRPVTGLMMRVYRLSGLVLENARQQTARHGLGFTASEVLVALRSTPPPHELAPTERYGLVLISSGGLSPRSCAASRAGGWPPACSTRRSGGAGPCG